MFKRYVLVAHELQLNPLTPHANAWEFMEAVRNGMSYRVWPGKVTRGPVAMKGMAFVFKNADAARLEYNRVHELSREPDTIKPKLFVVSSFSSRAALAKVLDHVHLKRTTGAEQIA
jgi:hypothetical protein